MFCSRCGKPASDNSRFCKFCGLQLTPPAQPNQTIVNATPTTDALPQRKRLQWLIVALPALLALAAIFIFAVLPALQSAAAYNKAQKLLDSKDYEAAAQAFASLGHYNDAADMTLEAQYQQGIAFIEQGEYDKADTLFISLGDFSDSNVQAKEARYLKSLSLLKQGSYDEAVLLLESLANYRDSDEVKLEALYQKGLTLIANGQYDEAIDVFTPLGDYNDSENQITFCTASKMISSHKYFESLQLLSSLDGFEGSDQLIRQCRQGLGRHFISSGFTYCAALSKDAVLSNMDNSDFSNWPRDLIDIVCDYATIFGLKPDGTVLFSSAYDEVYDFSPVLSWSGIVDIDASMWHILGVKSDGTVLSSGYGEDLPASDVSGWTDIVAVAAGDSHSVGLKADGTVVAVGKNESGECDVANWRDIVAVSAGDEITMGLKSDGTVVATGNNEAGQCDVSGWTDIVAISADVWHTVGLKSDGTVVAAGSNASDECNVENWKNIVAISAGFSNTFGVTSGGNILAVGYNNTLSAWNFTNWNDVGFPAKDAS